MHKRTLNLTTLALIASVVLLAACNMPATSSTPTVDANTVLTQAAGTVAVELTRSAALTPSPSPTNPPLPTREVAPQQPTATSAAPPPQATNTSAAAPASNSTTEDGASFVADITIPDGTGAAPGVPFTKTWRIKNTGKSTWTSSFALVYIDGEKMGSPDSIPMPTEVRPGETVDISVKLTAPQKSGSYQTFFRLRNADGKYFRLDGSGDLWIKIVVGGSSPTPNLTATIEATAEATTAP